MTDKGLWKQVDGNDGRISTQGKALDGTAAGFGLAGREMLVLRAATAALGGEGTGADGFGAQQRQVWKENG